MGSEISEFLQANGLRQVDLVKYLELSKPYISQVVNGTAKLSPEKLSKLINNDRGWDVSMLSSIQSSSIPSVSSEISILRERVAFLEGLIGQKDKVIRDKDITIDILMQRIYEFTGKGDSVKAG
jgi:transcriptional regulator with XRE-family HTH domain